MSNDNNKIYSFHYEAENKTRLDKFLAIKLNLENLSRVCLSKLISNGAVSINSFVELKPNKLLLKGDFIELKFSIPELAETKLLPYEIEIPIIYEDNDVIIINKPNNLVVHPGAGNSNETLVNALIFKTKNLSSIDEKFRPGIVHRLDKQTTGLLLIAKNNKSHYFLSNEMKNRNIKRVYLALVHGTINARSGTINAPIGRDVNNRIKMSVNEIKSRSATTHFEVLESFNNSSLVRCFLETGRTHQIRVHFQWINHPIVNDPVYSRFKIEDINLGQYLHAEKLTFTHPRTKKNMTFECDLPEFFQKKLQLLRKGNGNNGR